MNIKKTTKKIEKNVKKNPKKAIVISGLTGGVIVFATDHVVNFFINKGNDIKDDEDDKKKDDKKKDDDNKDDKKKDKKKGNKPDGDKK